jgi:hypothetical protein
LRLGYVADYHLPVVVLEDKIIAVLLSEAAGDALGSFLFGAMMCDPANVARAEP